MDKQQFDHIENSIRQAADDISVPFNETAWEKMEIKLDNEFNKDRRRIGLWWWFSAAVILIAASGVYFYHNSSSKTTEHKSITQIGNNNVQSSAGVTDNKVNSNVTTENKTPNHKATQTLNSTKADNTPSLITADAQPKNQAQHIDADKKTISSTDQSVNTLRPQDKNIMGTIKPGKGIRIDRPESGKTSDKLIAKSGKNATSALSDQTTLETEKAPADQFSKSKIEKRKNEGLTNNKVPDKLNSPVDGTNQSTSIPGVVTDSAKNLTSSDTQSNSPVIKTDSLKSVDSVSKKAVAIKLDNRTPKGFYFTASMAADVTGVKELMTTKEMKPVYGVGVGYKFNKRLSIQTGFYAGNKVYSAGPDDYYTKPGSYIATIISAQAECYIYDIPLTVRYDLFKQKKSNIYLVSGLSSYILKREYYDMHFLNPTGTYHHMSYTYKHNTSYLSILDFSVGYERKISDAFYIQAEPYVKIPLFGVGEGSVKLYSVGLQLGVKYQPFHKKK